MKYKPYDGAPIVCTGESHGEKMKLFRDLFEPRLPDVGSWHGFARTGPMPQSYAVVPTITISIHPPCDCAGCRRDASSAAISRATSPRWLNHQHQQIGLRTP